MSTSRDLRDLLVTYKPLAPRSAGETQESSASGSLAEPLGRRPELSDEVPTETALSDEEEQRLLLEFGQALTELKLVQGETPDPGVLRTPDHPMASSLQTYLALAASPDRIKLLPPGLGKEVAFDDKDLGGWIKSFFTWYKGIKKHAWLPPPTTIEDLPAKARVGVLGDWGTGLYGAPQIAKLIDADPAGYDLAIHLGDVYYSGLPEEVQQRFLDVWPKKPRRSRALNSNHEMYTGGYGYFDLTLPAFGQASSMFAMQNEDWMLIGLDTGYQEHDLAHDQVRWLTDLLAGAGSRRVILFSHHQPFSLFEKHGPKLIEHLEPLLASKRIFAWYFGHEHRCVIYDIHTDWQLRARLVGHSGYPYFRDKFGDARIVATAGTEGSWREMKGRDGFPGGIVLDGPNPFIPEKEKHEKYGPQGWVTIEINGANADEVYFNAEGEVLMRRPLA